MTITDPILLLTEQQMFIFIIASLVVVLLMLFLVALNLKKSVITAIALLYIGFLGGTSYVTVFQDPHAYEAIVTDESALKEEGYTIVRVMDEDEDRYWLEPLPDEDDDEADED